MNQKDLKIEDHNLLFLVNLTICLIEKKTESLFTRSRHIFLDVWHLGQSYFDFLNREIHSSNIVVLFFQQPKKNTAFL